MPALFTGRDSYYQTGATTFSTTLSFSIDIEPDDILLPNFFDIGGALFFVPTNTGDYIINYEFNEDDTGRISTTIVHFDTEERFYFWRHNVTKPPKQKANFVITINMSGGTRSDADVKVYEDGLELPLTEAIHGTATGPASIAGGASWHVAGTIETGPSTTNGYSGLMANAGIYNRILTAAEAQQIALGATPSDFGAFVDMPLLDNSDNVVTNTSISRLSEGITVPNSFVPRFVSDIFTTSDAITAQALISSSGGSAVLSPLGPIDISATSLSIPHVGPTRVF